MSAHPPPVPPEQRSDKASGKSNPAPSKEAVKDRDRNVDEQDRQGAVQQNTRNKGFQQDR